MGARSVVVEFPFSDHNVTAVIHKAKIKLPKTTKRISLRSKKNYRKDVFSRLLQEINWDLLEGCVSIDEMIATFENTVCGVLDKVAPVRVINFTESDNIIRKWITPELRLLETEKERLWQIYLDTMNSSNHQKYKRCRNSLNNKLKYAKESYYKREYEMKSEREK